MRKPILYTLVAISFLIMQVQNPVCAEDAASSSSATAEVKQAAITQPHPLSDKDLDTLVAPIALYPDTLLSQILVASTYPLEVVQATQWLEKHSDLKGKELTDAASKENWDASVQALVPFPEVLKRLNEDVTWTTHLGNAFLAQQDGVMDAVQRLRREAEDNGKLKTTDKDKVINTTESGQQVVEIQPSNPEVIYVPVYNPYTIWGPPSYYAYPNWYYPPPPPGYWCWWGPGVSIGFYFGGWYGWHEWGWHPYWYRHCVVVNTTFIHTYHFNTVHVTNVYGRPVWTHEPYHRLGVAYPNRAIAAHYYANTPRAAFYNRTITPAYPLTAAAVQNRMQAAAERAHAGPMSERMGNRQIPASVYNRSHTAFGGIGAGQTAHTYSARGYGSLGHGGTFHGAPRGGPTGGNHEGWSGGGHMGGGFRGGGHYR